MGQQNDINTASVEINTPDGVAFIEQASPLTRLHYFDGKFLKADALAQEQAYHRTQVQLANVAGGWGVVHGLGVRLSGDQLTVGAGLAVTPAGHFVMAVGDVSAPIADLLKLAATAPVVTGHAELAACTGQSTDKGVKETASLGLYEVTVGPVQGLCGNEPVYVSLCESACVTDSRHAWWREGLVLRLRPITLKLPTSSTVALTTTHLRNRVASAYFATEPGATASALSASGLASDAWCQTTSLYGRDEVVIGLLAREASVNRFIDIWAGRRERMEAQARGYWQGRMAMRPWNVYLAQILQFQCQLSGVFDDSSVVMTTPDNCDHIRAALDATRKELVALQKKYADSATRIVERLGGKTSKADAQKLADEVKVSAAELAHLSDQLSGIETGQGALPRQRLLLNNGFVQLPPAGYLPVQPGKTELTEQLSRMFGEGVRLSYRAARADVLPHLLEEAQHMERISLTQGLDHPDALEDVEIFVPDGRVVDVAAEPAGLWWEAAISPAARLLLSVFKLGDDGSDTSGGVGQDTMQAAADVQMQVNESASPQQILSLLKSGGGERAYTLHNNLAQTSGLGVGALDALTLEGMARTEARDDGSLGLTLVAGTDTDRVQQVMQQGQSAQVLAQAQAIELKKGRSKAASRASTEEVVVVAPSTRPEQIWYVAADLAGDPFALTVGDELALKAEVRAKTETRSISMGIDGRLQGTLTVLSRQLKSQGRTVLLVEIEGTHAVGIRRSGAADIERTGHMKFRVGLVRQGDGSTGVLLLDDAQFNDESAPLTVSWEGEPLEATVTVSGASEGQTVTLASLRALTSAPTASSHLGSTALNQLVTLSEVTQDAAFTVRARRRLFPTLETAATQRIEAVHDWVMFRRLRPAFCNPVCATPVQPSLEAFEVWHARVDSAKELKVLGTALEQGDAATVAEFAFQRVGVLRYRDDNTDSEETPAKVRALWQSQSLGKQVTLARSWETHPTAGQGWQNHFRLRTMLDEIASLTTPPARGDGTIATLAKPPAPLSQSGFDGGFLVVTSGRALLSPHRVLYLHVNLWRELAALFKKSPADGWKRLQELMSSDAITALDISLQISDNTLSASDIEAIKGNDAKIVQALGLKDPIMRIGVRLEAAATTEGEDVVAQSDAVRQVVDATLEQAIQIPSVTDLGDGAHVVTVLLYDTVSPQ